MQDALTVAMQTMHNALARVEGTSVNLANLTTAGYKRSVAVTRSFPDFLGIGAFAGARRLPIRCNPFSEFLRALSAEQHVIV